jgi:hypothetical protein
VAGITLVTIGAVAAWRAPALLRVETPADGETVGVGGVELLVRFDAPERVEASTFRARLNGADVTEGLLVAGNGAHGRLHTLLAGPNELEVSVFGRPWWSPGPLVEARRRLEIRFRPPTDWDRG